MDGMFSDSGVIMGFDGDRLDITVQDRREMFNATCVTMRRMAEALQKANKVLTFSLKAQSRPMAMFTTSCLLCLLCP